MKRIFPDRTVVAINGDGDFLMNGQEFATAVQYGLNIVPSSRRSAPCGWQGGGSGRSGGSRRRSCPRRCTGSRPPAAPPAAVAMKRIFPDRTVVAINGDGDFLMNGQEFATAVQYRERSASSPRPPARRSPSSRRSAPCGWQGGGSGRSAPTPQPGPVNLGQVMVHLREALPEDAILCNGAGNYAAWIHRFSRPPTGRRPAHRDAPEPPPSGPARR
jgi:hypothetical protein